jgi:hypothetical protein
VRGIAVEEHMATEAFLRVAHGLDVVAGDETEMDLMRTVESTLDVRARPPRSSGPWDHSG